MDLLRTSTPNKQIILAITGHRSKFNQTGKSLLNTPIERYTADEQIPLSTTRHKYEVCWSQYRFGTESKHCLQFCDFNYANK